jgi:hypothetical protein
MTGILTAADFALERADACLLDGRPEEAEAIYRQLLLEHPGHFALLLGVGRALEQQGRWVEAIAAYDEAIAANPGHALAFTRRAILAFRSAFGPPPAPLSPRPGALRVTMSTLGANGRFGNQLLQYGFLRMYAAEHGLAVEAPDWIGRDLFDFDDPLPQGPLPVVSERDEDLPASLNREVQQVHANTDLWGYCCYHTARLRRYRSLFRRLFKPGRRVAHLAVSAAERLRERGDTVVALHLRRGDFGYGNFWIAPCAWYAEWLDVIWERLSRPVLYVATDDLSAAAELRRFRPVTAADLPFAVPGAEFYIDFHILTEADALAISNSTFSFTAAMLNGRARSPMRPDRDRCGLVAFDPWDAPVLI